MLKKYIKEIQPYVEDFFKDDFTGHDIGHLTRTMNIAVKLCEKEKGDVIIVGIAAFLHDIHRIMQTELGHFVSPKDSLEKVKDILNHTDLTKEQIEEICFCVEHHEEYNWDGNNVTNVNALILQDADNIEAIGAVGIARAFSYGGARNIKMYDEKVSLIMDEEFSEENWNEPSMLHHFYHKLFKLADNMNTESAKKIALARTKYMREFAQEFLDEWEGNK